MKVSGRHATICRAARIALAGLIIVSLLAALAPLRVRAQAAPVTLTFQDGVSPSASYSGTADAYLSQAAPTSKYWGNSSLRVDGDDPAGSGNDLSTLLAWDISAIPAGSTVTAASITLQITNATAVPYPVYPVLRRWVEREVTWNLAATGSSWQAGGALGEEDRGAAAVASVAASGLGSYTFSLNADGLALVERWINTPAENYGLIIGDSVIDDGLTFLSSEQSALASRPRLTVTYLPPGSSPTATEAPPATETPVWTDTPLPTDTPPEPTATETSLPTDTPAPADTSTPTVEATQAEPPTATATDAATATPEGVTPTAEATPVATATTEPTNAPSTMPRYTILFIGDGMGFEHVRAAGMYRDGSPGGFSFESFPYRGELITRSASTSVTDSAASGTALATGNTVYNAVISMAYPGDLSELTTLLEMARAAGRQTGLVTTSYMTDATTAVFGAHELSRNSTSAIAGDYLNQTRPHVLLGGGGNGLTPASAAAAGYTVVENRAEMLALSGAEEYVSGQFTTSRLPYEIDGMGIYPHLSEMTRSALDLLDDDPDGFFLVVEGGLIDLGAHANNLPRTVAEVIEFGSAVDAALEWAAGRSDALILVTADHETGGLQITGGGGAPGVYPTVTWSTANHTNANVPIYAVGANASAVYGVMENEEVFAIVSGQRAPRPTATPDPVTPTATASATGTPEVLTPTATATHTATATPVASATPEMLPPTATATATATPPAPSATPLPPTPTASSTAPLTPTRTATASATPVSTPLTLTLQQGVVGYSGMTDAYIQRRAATTNAGSAASLRINGDDPRGSGYDTSSLLRWDVSAVPPGATVVSVSLRFSVSDISAQTYTFYPLLRSWSESSVTWNRAATGVNWQVAGAAGSADRGTTALADLRANIKTRYTVELNSAGVALVQGWVNNPSSNYGLILHHPTNNDGLILVSSEGSTASRPALVITYRVD